MLRIGVVGTTSSHVGQVVRLLNDEGRFPGVRVTALSTDGRPPASRVDHVVDHPAGLLGLVDAAVVAGRDGADHLAQATPLLRAGLPVLVDKPLTASVRDADALLTLADRHGALVTSASALRFARELPASEQPLRLHLVGPGEVDGPYSGLFFYGIHLVEAALEILGNPPVDPRELRVRARRDDAGVVVASCEIAGTPVTLTFVPPTRGRVPFHVTLVDGEGVVSRPLSLGADYLAPVLATFVASVASGRPPLSRPQLVGPVAVLEAVTSALDATHDAGPQAPAGEEYPWNP